MTSKIMSVFYGEDKLPYKDRERKVHYPILEGSLITGENNTRTIRCYTGLIGGSGRTWIANVKKPDGTLFYQLCTNAQTIDGEYSVDIDISSVYADTSGAIYIALQGYSGDVVITDEDDDGTYEISGNPEVFPTGTIKVLVNYAPQVLPKGETLSPTTEQLILAGFNAKLDKTSGIITVASLPISTLGYSANQLVYNKADGVLYIVQNNAFAEVSYCIDFKDIDITQASISVVANHLYFGKVVKGSDTPFADNLDVLYCFKDKSNGIVFANGNIYCLVGGTWYSNLNKDASGDVVAHEFYDGNSKTNINKLVNTNALLSAITYLETYADGKETSAKAYTDALKNTKGQANGIAPLDANSKVDVSYIPTTIARTSECATFIQLTLDPTTYILKAKLISKDAVPLWEAQVDLPLETMVVSGSYDAVNKKIVLTLKNGQTIDIPVGDLVSGLISTSDIIDDCEHTDTNKPLSAKQGRVLKELIDLKANATDVDTKSEVNAKIQTAISGVNTMNVIVDEGNTKNYNFQLKVRNGKPVLILNEIV